MGLVARRKERPEYAQHIGSVVRDLFCESQGCETTRAGRKEGPRSNTFWTGPTTRCSRACPRGPTRLYARALSVCGTLPFMSRGASESSNFDQFIDRRRAASALPCSCDLPVRPASEEDLVRTSPHHSEVANPDKNAVTILIHNHYTSKGDFVRLTLHTLAAYRQLHVGSVLVCCDSVHELMNGTSRRCPDDKNIL